MLSRSVKAFAIMKEWNKNMKNLFSLFLCLIVGCFMFACSKDSGRGTKNTEVKIVKIYYETQNSVYVTADEDIIVSAGKWDINLMAIPYDKDGKVLNGYPINWSCSDTSLVSFSQVNSMITKVSIQIRGYEREYVVQITADCNGTKRTVNIKIQPNQ